MPGVFRLGSENGGVIPDPWHCRSGCELSEDVGSIEAADSAQVVVKAWSPGLWSGQDAGCIGWAALHRLGGDVIRIESCLQYAIVGAPKDNGCKGRDALICSELLRLVPNPRSVREVSAHAPPTLPLAGRWLYSNRLYSSNGMQSTDGNRIQS